jgi:hypothetical protein
MASAVATAANVSFSGSSRREERMTIDASTDRFKNVLVVMDDFKKTDHSAPYSPNEVGTRACKLLN